MPQPNWNRLSRNQGYLIVHCPEHHDANPAGYIFVHRWVAEQKIGRPIRKGQHVHHINEDKQDNRPENLQVVTAAEHAHIHMSKKTKDIVKLPCPQCRRPFERRRGQTHLVPSRSKQRTFCSRRCSGLYSIKKRKARPLRKRA